MSAPGISQKTIRLEYGTPNPSYFSAVQGSLLMPYKAVMSFWTLRNIGRHPELPLTEQMPDVQTWCEWAANKCGLNPSYPRISELHLPAISIKKLRFPFTEKEFTLKLPVFNTSHLIKEESLIKATLKPHRRLEFNGSASYDTFFELTKKIFPETQFDTEDTLFTCGPEFSKIARGCIHEALSASDLNAILNNHAQSLIERWDGCAASGEKFNVVPETNQFATGVMVDIFLGEAIESESICDSVHYMNAYLYRRALGLNTREEDSKFLECCKIFNGAVNQLLDNETKGNRIPLFSQNSKQDESVKLTLPQKQALILTLFFAGQETTAFGLDALIGFYALNPSEQDEVLDEIQADNKNIHECKKVREAVTRRLLEAPPANGIAKKLRSPTRIVFEDTDGKAFSKYMKEGEKIVPVIGHAAHKILKESLLEDEADPIQLVNRASVFGFGAHGCPGKKLALQELLQLPIIILQNFILMTEEKEFRYHPQLTNQAEPFYITVKKRENKI